jgi:malonyl-CoA O-methyltransferase
MLNKLKKWVSENTNGKDWVTINHKNLKPYPEVTGYFIESLLAIGEIKAAERFALWLVTVQNLNGSFSLDDPRKEYVFDTGQIIRGWVSVVDRLPQLKEPLLRACNWITHSADPETGAFIKPLPGGDWLLNNQRGEVSEGIHLYVIKPLLDAAKVLDNQEIKISAEKALKYYLKTLNLTDFEQKNMLSHFYGYIQEALVELDQIELAKIGMSSIEKFQLSNGAVRAYFDVNWVCSTGLAQLAKVWLMLNDVEKAERAINFLSNIQNPTGGFYGSYGVSANYFPSEEIPWAVKYAIDAELLKIKVHFNNTASQYSKDMRVEDGRMTEVLRVMSPQVIKVLDAGCGNGRFAKNLKKLFPLLEIHAMDISEEMIRSVPAEVNSRIGALEAIPFKNEYFDFVYCIEALEHSVNHELALHEMIRVLKKGGTLLIIDKNLKFFT